MNAIEATDVSKAYGDVQALDGLSLSVDPGATFGLLGTNGAGKSTLFRLLVGHTRPDAGSLAVGGADVVEAGPAIRRTVGYLPEHAGFPATLTGREVLGFTARMRDIPAAADRIDDALSLVGLTDAADRRVGGYSNGMSRRLGLATALLSRPRILLLDEPTAGLDPRGVRAFHRIVEALGERDDLTVVLSSHVLSEVESLCDTVAVLHDGRLLTEGPVAELRRQARDGVSVHLRLADPAAADDARAAVARADGSVRSASGTRLVVDCPSAAVPGLLADVTGSVPLDGYEVREPGLEQVFERALESAEGVRG